MKKKRFFTLLHFARKVKLIMESKDWHDPIYRQVFKIRLHSFYTGYSIAMIDVRALLREEG